MARLPSLRLKFWEGRWYLALAGLIGLTLCIVGFVIDLGSPSGRSRGPWLLAGLLKGSYTNLAKHFGLIQPYFAGL